MLNAKYQNAKIEIKLWEKKSQLNILRHKFKIILERMNYKEEGQFWKFLLGFLQE